MRKIIIVLAIAFLMCFSQSVMAATASQTDMAADIQSKMLRILQSVAVEKEYYNLQDVDFSAVQLGVEIPAYRVAGQSLNRTDISFVPIINENKLVAFFYVSPDLNGEIFVQLSSDLVAPISQFISQQPFALIYDDMGLYIYTEGEVHLLGYAGAARQPEPLNLISALPDSVFATIDTQTILLDQTLTVEQPVSAAEKIAKAKAALQGIRGKNEL